MAGRALPVVFDHGSGAILTDVDCVSSCSATG
jgi:hypothetical protein